MTLETIYLYGAVAAAAYFLSNGVWNLAIEKRHKFVEFANESPLSLRAFIAVFVFMVASLTVAYAVMWPVAFPAHIYYRATKKKSGAEGGRQ